MRVCGCVYTCQSVCNTFAPKLLNGFVWNSAQEVCSWHCALQFDGDRPRSFPWSTVLLFGSVIKPPELNMSFYVVIIMQTRCFACLLPTHSCRPLADWAQLHNGSCCHQWPAAATVGGPCGPWVSQVFPPPWKTSPPAQPTVKFMRAVGLSRDAHKHATLVSYLFPRWQHSCTHSVREMCQSCDKADCHAVCSVLVSSLQFVLPFIRKN